MKVIKLIHPHQFNRDDFPEMAMAFGYFDGVHLGHQRVINEAKRISFENGWKSAVMTFDPHPSVVLGKTVQHAEYITPLPAKIELIAGLGVDYLFVVQFTTDFSNLLPQEFIDQYVIGLNVRHVVAGFDFRYGRMGKGTMETIPFHSRNEFDYTVVPKFSLHNEKVSSTLIRSIIKSGEMERLAELLGGAYFVCGTVVHGDKRGRTIGFPTANVDTNGDYLLPPSGVYAVRIKIDEHWYNGVCNLGVRPTFYDKNVQMPSIEVHIFDFSGDIYGKRVTVQWYKRIRSEQKFPNIEALIGQIQKDKQEAVAFFEKNYKLNQV